MYATWNRGGVSLEHFVPKELVQKNRCSLEDCIRSTRCITEINHFPMRKETLLPEHGHSHGEGVQRWQQGWVVEGGQLICGKQLEFRVSPAATAVILSS